MRRSMLFIPGNTPNLLVNANILGADSLIFDLEDAVSPAEKDAARILVRNALATLSFAGTETVVRINSIDTPYWKADLAAIVPQRPDAILLPKTNSPRDIAACSLYLAELEDKVGLGKNAILLFPLIETARGIENALAIGEASDRIKGLILGGEDLSADLQAVRSKEGQELAYARSRIVSCARACGLDAIDTVFTDVNDDEGIYRDSFLAKSLGFSGKLSISPRHIATINRVFSPDREEIAHAYAVREAIRKAKEEGRGVIALHGKMIDAPVAARAERIIQAAEELGLAPEETRGTDEPAELFETRTQITMTRDQAEGGSTHER